jgi:transposase
MCRRLSTRFRLRKVAGREGEVRYFGEIEATQAAVERFVRKLEKKHSRLYFCYEAGPTGYGRYRQIVELDHRCNVVAPSQIPKRPGERVKTNRRDAVSLARLLRAGGLKGIWVPDTVHEAVRDLVRVRSTASEDLRKKRQQLLSFLLRHGRVFTGHKNWSRAHARWLAAQKFEHPAQQIVFQDQVDVITDAQDRLERLDAHLAELVPSWSMAPVVAAYRWCILHRRRHLRQRSRRCPSLRQSAAADGLSGPGALGALNWRHGEAWQPDAGRQPARTPGPGGGRLELSLTHQHRRKKHYLASWPVLPLLGDRLGTPEMGYSEPHLRARDDASFADRHP